MLEQTASRRTVIGALMVGGAAIGSVRLLDRDADDAVATNARVRVVPAASPAGFVETPHEVERWSVAVGETVAITGETGRVASVIQSVVPVRHAGKLPAGVRQEPFAVRLAMDPLGAPAGDRIYTLSTPIAGLTDVFLTRRADVAGKAILMALFA